jgi:GntR family transcriptional regulator, transcriptional repressor for pyruvate dehydrogenase complex
VDNPDRPREIARGYRTDRYPQQIRCLDGVSPVRPVNPVNSSTQSAQGKRVPVAITDEAIEKIKEMIVSGALRPGDRLPREADLAERLGLSRNSLREAVKALSLIHVLDVRQGDGTYVTSLEPSVLLDAMGFVIDFHRDDTVLEFLEVRRILEPAATAMAAANMTPDDVAELRSLLDKLGEDPSIEELVANDLEFHRRIALGSGNQVLCSLVEGLSGPTQRARIWRGLTQESAVARTLAEHHAICDAIAAGQPEVARAWSTVHVAGVEQWLREVLTETPPAG